MRSPALFAALLLILGSAAFAAPAAPVDPARRLDLARHYLEGGDYEKAEEHLEAVLLSVEADEANRRAAEGLLLDVLAASRAAAAAEAEVERERQASLVAEARRLVVDGRLNDAASLIKEQLKVIEDPDLRAEANRVLEDAHPRWQVRWFVEHVHRAWEWVGAFLLVSVCVGLPLTLLVVSRVIYAEFHADDYLVTGIEDTTGLGVAETILHSFDRWSRQSSPVSAGLLKLERLPLETSPRIERRRPKLDLAPALEALPALGGVKVGAVAKLMTLVPRWFRSARPSIEGKAGVAGKRIVVRLSAYHADGSIQTVEGVAANDDPDAAALAASYKMYYLIANESSVSQAELAQRLSGGLKKLNAYVSTGDSEALQEAYATFQAVRGEAPAYEEAYLYEGIALDLMERHDEAAARFRFLAENAQGEMRDKGIYNEAISRFRSYRPESLAAAIDSLRRLIGQEARDDLQCTEPKYDRFVESPIKALALAAEANAIAHQPIFWQPLALKKKRTKEDDEVKRRKVDARDAVRGWVMEVEVLTRHLEAIHGLAETWDPLVRQQLRWATENARGNINLNFAQYFLTEPHVEEDEAEQRQECLERALEAFKECEVLMPPSVETLTNLATVLLALRETSSARKYARKAIERNPSYEYGYYRLAESWAEDDRREKVQETLRSFPLAPTIGGFREMFRDYYVEPKSE